MREECMCCLCSLESYKQRKTWRSSRERKMSEGVSMVAGCWLKNKKVVFFKREMFLLLQIKGSLVAPVSSQCWMNNFNFHVLLFFSYYRLGSGTLLSSLWLRLRGNLTLPSTGVAPSPMCSPGCPMVVRESLSYCPETPRTTKMLPLRGSAESWRR